MNGAVLAVRRRPALLDRLDQPGRAVGDDQHRRAEPAGDQIAAERQPVLVGLAHPQHHRQQHPLAVLGEPPRDQARPPSGRRAGPRERSRRGTAPTRRGCRRGRRRWNASKRSCSSSQIRDAVDFDSFPSPACSHSDSTSRIDRPRTNAPITNAFSGSVRNSLRAPREQLGHERLGRLADLRDLDRELALGRLHPPRAKPVAQSPAAASRPALIAGATQPRVELVLDRPLDDQPSAEPGQLGQRLARVLTHPDGKQLVDLLFYLRRRRYGTSHGVGLLHRLGRT